MHKYIFILLAMFLCFSCEKELSEEQADYFLKFYGTYLDNFSSAVSKSDDGGYVIIGTTETEEKMKDIYFLKTDRFGRQIGDIKVFGGDWDDYGICLEDLPDGYLVGGSMTDSTGTRNAFLQKTDKNGIAIGDMIIYGKGNNRNDEFNSVVHRADGAYLAAGYSGDNILIVSYNPFSDSRPDEKNAVINSLLPISDNWVIGAGTVSNLLTIVKINPSGNPSFEGEFGNPVNMNRFASFLQLSETNFLLLSNVSPSGLNFSVNLWPVNYNGNELEEDVEPVVFGGSGSYEANSLIKLGNGNLAMLVTRSFAGDKNILLYILDANGNQLGEPKEFGGSGDQEGVALLDDEGSILILGTNAFEGNTMISLIKTDYQGNIWN